MVDKINGSNAVSAANTVSSAVSVQDGNQKINITFPKSSNDGNSQRVQQNLVKTFEEFADVAEYKTRWFKGNEIVLDGSKGMTLGQIREKFQLEVGALKCSNDWMQNYAGNLDECVTKQDIAIPIDIIGKRTGSYGSVSRDISPEDTVNAFKQVKSQYEENRANALAFIGSKSDGIIYQKDKGDKNGAYILIPGDGASTLGDYKTALSLRSGVIKNNNDFHASDLDKYKPNKSEYVKVYVKDIAVAGVKEKEVKKLID